MLIKTSKVSVSSDIVQLNTDSNLINLSSSLLNILITIKLSDSLKDIIFLRETIFKKVNEFHQKASALNYSSRLILAAEYCLCAALDETIMSRQFHDGEASWDEMSLLSYYYKETFAGEKFFIILNNMLEMPKENIVILELFYVLLSLGYKGQFYNKDPFILKSIRQDLAQKIFSYRATNKIYLLNSPTFSISSFQNFPIPLWTILPITGFVLFIVSLILSYQLSVSTEPIFKILNSIADNFEQINK